MFFDFTVETPQEKGIVFKKRGGVVYVEYTYDRVYNPDKKYNVPKRTTIGRLDENDEKKMYPNPSFKKYFPDVDLSDHEKNIQHSSMMKIGAYTVLKKIIKDYELDKLINSIIGDKSGLFLDLACYSIITEDNVAQYYPAYAYNHALHTDNMYVYSDSSISDFLQDITVDDSLNFLLAWNDKHDKSEKVYISYDSTNKSCQAGDIEIAEFGHPKDGDDKPIVNLAVAYDCNNKEPLFYETYCGSIVDVAQLPQMMKKAAGYGYKCLGFILDRGYFSKKNIDEIDKAGFSFIIMLKGKKALVKDIVDKYKDSFENDINCDIPEYGAQGITITRKLYESDEVERHIHLYYSGSKYNSERESLMDSIRREQKILEKYIGSAVTMPKCFNKHFEAIYHEDGTLMGCMPLKDVIMEELKYCGYFCIITSEEMTAREALRLYKGRDASEKLFRADKTYLGNSTYRTHSREALDSKMFIEFIALIIRNKFYNYLQDKMIKDGKKSNYFSVPAAIAELEKIEALHNMKGDFTLDHAITKKQRAILSAVGMTARDINNVLSEMNKINFK